MRKREVVAARKRAGKVRSAAKRRASRERYRLARRLYRAHMLRGDAMLAKYPELVTVVESECRPILAAITAAVLAEGAK